MDVRRAFGRLVRAVRAAVMVAFLGGAPVGLTTLARWLLGGRWPWSGFRPAGWHPDRLFARSDQPLSTEAVVEFLSRFWLSCAWLTVVIVAVNVIAEVAVQTRRGVTMRPVRGFTWSQRIARRIVALVLSLSSGVPLSAGAAHPPASVSPAAPGRATVTAVAAIGSPSTYEVRRGDSYWAIADHHLEIVLGVEPSESQVLDHTRQVMDANVARLGNRSPASMLYPGDELILPDPADPPVVAATPEPPPTFEPSAPVTDVSITLPPITPTPPTPTPPASTADGSNGPIPEPTLNPEPTLMPEVTSPPVGSPVSPLTSDVAADVDQRAAGGSVPVGPVIAVAGLLALATGLGARVRLLHRRRHVRTIGGTRSLSARSRMAEQALLAAADLPLVRWAGQHLAVLTAGLDRRTIDGWPVAVELSDVQGIELLWSSPQPRSPLPWRVADGGWSWRLAFDPDQPTPAGEFPAPFPTLVTVGHRDDRQLLLDLEAVGSLQVTGDRRRVADFLRSIATELAANDELCNAYVHTIGLDPTITGLARLTECGTVDDAVRRLDSARTTVTAALDEAGVASTFEARLGAVPPIEATVVVGHADDNDVDRLLTAAPRHTGVAAVIAGNGNIAAGARIILHADGSARLLDLGVDFHAVALTADTATTIDALLDELHHPARPDSLVDAGGNDDLAGNLNAAPDPKSDDATCPPSSSTNVTDDGSTRTAADDEPVTPAMVVRVLGTPFVPDRPHLGRRELALTVLLACRAQPIAASAAQDALWGGKPVEAKTVWNLIGATRKALGDLPDGTPVMPQADRTRSTLRLAPAVTTDLAILRRLYDTARQQPSSTATTSLRDALALVNGPPFDAPGYDWAHRDQHVTEASDLIEAVTRTLVAHALDAADLDQARDAIRQGLRGLPGNEELYRCRMRAEHQAGNLPAIKSAYEELNTYLTDLDTEPSPTTTTLYHELIRRRDAHERSTHSQG
ncbi:MAG: BTAD domain-containing putative transcriptional regulator [Acidimicrobiia bacterium]